MVGINCYVYCFITSGQVMPQLLYYLKMDVVSGPSVDWGTLLIYTCADNCSTGPAYHQEFLWKQRFST